MWLVEIETYFYLHWIFFKSFPNVNHTGSIRFANYVYLKSIIIVVDIIACLSFTSLSNTVFIFLITGTQHRRSKNCQRWESPWNQKCSRINDSTTRDTTQVQTSDIDGQVTKNILLQQSVNDFQPNSSQILQMFTILLHSCHFTNKMKSSGLSFIGYLYVLIFGIGLLNTRDNFILMFLFLFI